MINLTRKEAQQVLEGLENIAKSDWRKWEELADPKEFERWVKARANHMAETLRARLSAPEPEPVAWHEPGAYGNVTVYKDWAKENGWFPLYTTPPQPEPPCKTGSQCIGGKGPQCVVSEPEPVAWMNESDMGRTDWKVWAHGKPTATIPLYAAPPQREWQGLTDEEREEATGWSVEHIEAKLKEKNT